MRCVRIMKKQNLKNQRSGIALITVLGFLSIILIMALTLMTMTRVEKLVSKSAEQLVMARQLSKSALATAMDEVDTLLWDTGPGYRIHSGNDDMIFSLPPADYAAGAITGVVLDLLFDAQTLDWLPDRYADATPELQWVQIKDREADINGDYPILGRYAYIAFDCTGLLDANLVDQSSMPRANGTSLGEVKLDRTVLEDMRATAGENLQHNRSHYKRFDTFGEIIRLNNGTNEPCAWNSGWSEDTVFVAPNNSLTPYSLAYDTAEKGWWDWEPTVMWWRPPGEFSDTLSGPSNIVDWSESYAASVFGSSDFNYANPADMAQCLMDYMDTDFTPKSTQIPCCEPIPMINEVIISEELRIIGGASIRSTMSFDVELWFPFQSITNGHTYEVSITMGDIEFNRGVMGVACREAGSPFFILAPNAANPIAVTPVDLTVTRPPFNNNWFSTVKIEFEFNAALPVTTPISYPIKTMNDITKITINLLDLDEGTTVDTAETTTRIRVQTQLSAGLVANSSEVGLAVKDPRLNHDSGQWAAGSITRDALNFGGWGTGNDNIGKSQNGDLECTNLYVRNGPPESQAELGFIPTGEPWTTIDLFSNEGRKLLQVLRDADQPMPNQIFGTVNPNSQFTNVLRAVFFDAPTENPGQTNRRVVSAMADLIAEGMTEYTAQPRSRGDALDSAAAWVTTAAFIPGGTLTDQQGLNNNQKESIIRNSYRLFNANNNLFTYVIIAQAIKDDDRIGQWDGEDIDIPSGESRIVALVWRDPFPNEDGRHTQFIRRIKYMQE